MEFLIRTEWRHESLEWTRSMVLLWMLGGVFMMGCSSDEPMDNPIPDPVITLTTIQPTEITHESVMTGGRIDGVSPTEVNEMGVVFALQGMPTVDNEMTLFLEMMVNNRYNLELKDLIADTTYYFRAFVELNDGTIIYGNQLLFATLPLPVPCDPLPNTARYDQTDLTFSTTLDDQTSVGDEYIITMTSPQADLTMTFSSAPESAEYWIKSEETLGRRECRTVGQYNGVEYGPVVNEGIYVLKTGEDQYSITFCDIKFSNVEGQEWKATGNWTLD